METQHKALWTASLSNGETVHEEKGEYKRIDGEPSPWVRLCLYIAEKNLSITSLAVYSQDGRRFNLPSTGTNPRFAAFSENEPPIGFNMFRKIGVDFIGGKETQGRDIFTVVEAAYESGLTLQMWVDNRTLNAWTLIV